MPTLDPYFLQKQVQEFHTFQDRFRKLFEHIPSLVFSGKGEIIQINQSAEQALGMIRQQLVGRTFYNAGCRVLNSNRQYLPVKKQPWCQALRSNVVITNVVTGLILPDGTCRWQQSTSMPLKDSAHGNKKLSISIITDITKYKQTQSELLQTQKMKSIGSMATGLAHDFNNILTSIHSALQIPLMDYDTSEQGYEALKDIETEVLRGAELTKQLLLFSKPSDPKHKTTYINKHIHQLRKLLKRVMPKNIKIEAHFSKDEIMAHIEPTKFEQIFFNLAINARDAMPSGGTLKINTSIISWTKTNEPLVLGLKHGTYAQIEVSDTGVGIKPENISRIFEPFYTSKGPEKGTGLGLSIVYAIAHQHNGHITANSMPAKGSNLTVFLPAKHASKQTAKTVKEKKKPQTGSETILIIDDEKITTKSTSRFFERYGYNTITAYDGKEGLETYIKHKKKIDLVLMDMEMPEMNGLDCLKQMLKENPDVKVIMLSGHLLKHDNWNPIKTGAKMFIQKPFDANELAQMARKVLDSDKTS